MRAGIFLLLLALFASVPQLGFDEWRGTEARRVQIAMEMEQADQWMVPLLGGEATFVKPPLYYWVLRGVLQVSDAKWALRLPSVLAFWLLSLVVFSMLRRTRNAEIAWLGAIGVLLSPLVLSHIATAEVDPLFAALTGISLVWLGEAAAYGQRGRLIAAGLVGGLAFLTKGTPYFLFLFGIVLIWLRRWRLRGLLWFAVPFLAVAAAYYGSLIAYFTDTDELVRVLGGESLSRFQASLGQRILRLPDYLGRACGVLFPIGLWTFHEYRGSVAVREVTVKPDEAVLRFCAGAALGALVLLLFAAHRPSRYLLPAAPLFVCAVAPAAAAYMLHRAPLTPGLAAVLRVVGIIGALGLVALPFAPQPFAWRTAALLVVLASGPLLVRQRHQMVLFVVVLVPLVASWTLYVDRLAWERGRHLLYAPAARVLQREGERLGVDPARLATRGHFMSQVLLEGRQLPPGDERAVRPAQREWLLVEDPDDPEVDVDSSEVPGYVDRVRVRNHRKSLLLKQRQ